MFTENTRSDATLDLKAEQLVRKSESMVTVKSRRGLRRLSPDIPTARIVSRHGFQVEYFERGKASDESAGGWIGKGKWVNEKLVLGAANVRGYIHPTAIVDHQATVLGDVGAYSTVERLVHVIGSVGNNSHLNYAAIVKGEAGDNLWIGCCSSVSGNVGNGARILSYLRVQRAVSEKERIKRSVTSPISSLRKEESKIVA